MTQRKPGYYWVVWTDLADVDVKDARPAPLIGEWDGRFWWFARMASYRFDCEVEVVDDLLLPSEKFAPGAEFSRPASRSAGALAGSASCP